MLFKKSVPAIQATPKNEIVSNPQKFQRSSSSSTSGRSQYRTNEEEEFVPKLKFNGAERISSNYHEFAEALHQAAALKLSKFTYAKLMKQHPYFSRI
jgi:hypothetical protein